MTIDKEFDITQKTNENFDVSIPGFFISTTYVARLATSISLSATPKMGLSGTAAIALTSPALAMSPTTVTSGHDNTSVTTTNDMYIEVGNTGFFNPTKTWINAGYYVDGGVDRRCKWWIPFTVTEVLLPEDTVIISATLKVVAVATRSDSLATIKFYCENSVAVTTPTNYNACNTRTTTAAYTNAIIDGIVTGTVYSFDVTAPVQEIINKTGWASGNTLAIIMIDNGSPTGSQYRLPSFASYDNTTYDPPELLITIPV